MTEPNHLRIMQFKLAGVFFLQKLKIITFYDVYEVCRLLTFVVSDVCHIMMFVALWCLLVMAFVTLWCLSRYDVCCIMTFLGYDISWLWRLSPYDVCRLMTFVALWHLSVMMFVVLWCLSLMRFNGMSLMTFVAVPKYCIIWNNAKKFANCKYVVSEKNITSKEDNFQATLFSRGITNVKFNWNIKLSNYWNFYES